MINLFGKKVTVIGSARSGQAAARLAVKLKAKVRISEAAGEETVEHDFKDWAAQQDILFEFGGHTKDFIITSDLLIVSPGVRLDAAVLQWAHSEGIPVWGEIELASQCCSRPIIAVTGSNGKTTVVTLIKDVLNKTGKKVQLCGNVGVPFSDYCLDLDAVDYVVLEMSSFQLETVLDFKPHIALFLNFSQNHLDRHKDIDAYFHAKKRIFENQASQDYAVLNAGEERIKGLAVGLQANVNFFNKSDSSGNGTPLNPNFLAVAEVAKILNIPRENCQEVFDSFQGIEHRLERVRTLNGIDFINDSKATTAEAGRWAIENIDQPIVMICGGRDKNTDFSVLTDLVSQKVKKMVVFGEARDKLKRTFDSVVGIKECDSLQQAVPRARACAALGDCVLLSPMCASFDSFKNFEERGNAFKEIVKNLKD